MFGRKKTTTGAALLAGALSLTSFSGCGSPRGNFDTKPFKESLTAELIPVQPRKKRVSSTISTLQIPLKELKQRFLTACVPAIDRLKKVYTVFGGNRLVFSLEPGGEIKAKFTPPGGSSSYKMSGTYKQREWIDPVNGKQYTGFQFDASRFLIGSFSAQVLAPVDSRGKNLLVTVDVQPTLPGTATISFSDLPVERNTGGQSKALNLHDLMDLAGKGKMLTRDLEDAEYALGGPFGVIFGQLEFRVSSDQIQVKAKNLSDELFKASRNQTLHVTLKKNKVVYTSVMRHSLHSDLLWSDSLEVELIGIANGKAWIRSTPHYQHVLPLPREANKEVRGYSTIPLKKLLNLKVNTIKKSPPAISLKGDRAERRLYTMNARVTDLILSRVKDFSEQFARLESSVGLSPGYFDIVLPGIPSIIDQPVLSPYPKLPSHAPVIVSLADVLMASSTDRLILKVTKDMLDRDRVFLDAFSHVLAKNFHEPIFVEAFRSIGRQRGEKSSYEEALGFVLAILTDPEPVKLIQKIDKGYQRKIMNALSALGFYLSHQGTPATMLFTRFAGWRLQQIAEDFSRKIAVRLTPVSHKDFPEFLRIVKTPGDQIRDVVADMKLLFGESLPARFYKPERDRTIKKNHGVKVSEEGCFVRVLDEPILRTRELVVRQFMLYWQQKYSGRRISYKEPIDKKMQQKPGVFVCDEKTFEALQQLTLLRWKRLSPKARNELATLAYYFLEAKQEGKQIVVVFSRERKLVTFVEKNTEKGRNRVKQYGKLRNYDECTAVIEKVVRFIQEGVLYGKP